MKKLLELELLDIGLKHGAAHVKVWVGGLMVYNNFRKYKESINEFNAEREWLCVH